MRASPGAEERGSEGEGGPCRVKWGQPEGGDRVYGNVRRAMSRAISDVL